MNRTPPRPLAPAGSDVLRRPTTSRNERSGGSRPRGHGAPEREAPVPDETEPVAGAGIFAEGQGVIETDGANLSAMYADDPYGPPVASLADADADADAQADTDGDGRAEADTPTGGEPATDAQPGTEGAAAPGAQTTSDGGPEAASPHVQAAGQADAVPDTPPPGPAPEATQAPAPTRRGRRTTAADADLEPGAAPSRGERVGAALRVWRGELAETGGPNALLWYRDSPDGTLDLTKAHPTGVSMLMAGNTVRLSHLVREQAAFAHALRTARRIRVKALELREDHGLDASHVCVGMATWGLPGTQRRPAAPIMLRAVRLHAVDAAESDLELELSHRVEINPVFLHYMASEQGVRLDGDDLADLAFSTGRFDPLPVYRELRRLLLHVEDFTITDRRVLSTFAPTKMAMVADLAAFAGLLAGNDVIAALAGDPGAGQALRSDGDAGLVDVARRSLEPDLAREALVLDADPSQAAVVDAARSGHHVLLDAAPGTGRTQTLANVAAALVGNDQRVLVISEDARQLGDLADCLTRAGLGDLILDARDPHALRHRLPADMLARIDGEDEDEDFRTAYRRETRGAAEHGLGGPAEPEEAPEQEVARTRGRLLAHVDCLHAPRQPWGVSVFEAQTALATLSAREAAPTSRVRIPAAALRALTADRLGEVAAEATAVVEAGAWTTTPDDDDPWWGARFATNDDVVKALATITELSEGRLASDREALDGALADAGLPPARTARDWGLSLGLIGEVRHTLATFRAEVYARPLDPLIAAVDPGNPSSSSWWSRNGARKEARALALPHARVDSLHEALCTAKDQQERWAARGGRDAEPRVPEGYDGALTRWERLEADLSGLDRCLAGTRAGAGLLDADLDALAERLAGLAARADRMSVLPAVAARLDALAEQGLAGLLDDLARRHVPASQVAAEAEFVWWRSILDLVAEEDPTYGSHDGAALRALQDRYVEIDRALFARRAEQVRDRARAHARVEASTRPDQVNTLRDAAELRRPRALRGLLAETGDVVAAIAPIWLLSPLTLASVVPTHLAFDAVLIDDAGRMPVAHAVSALARGVRVVAVGDAQGLAPQPFDTVAGPDDEADEDDGLPPMTSVLAALARYLPVRHLQRTYGDRDPRLTSFVAAAREEDVTAWPNAGRGPALRLLRTGAVISSADQAGEAEARENARVIEVVLEHARRHPEASLAVVAPSGAQAARIDALLRTALPLDAKAAAAPALAESSAERLLVTTIDRAAGHPCDTVVFATGVEPAPGPAVRLPERLTRDDAPRALDAVAGLARRRLDIVCAVTGGDLARLPGGEPGLRRLAELLTHAERDGEPSTAAPEAAGTSGAVAPAASGASAEQPAPPRGQHALLAELAARLRTEGLVVHEGFGVGGCEVDLVVDDPYTPGRRLVAVLSDGVRHAGVATVRERERLLPEQLERRGWRWLRVCSTDVFRDPARDVARIVDCVRGEG